MNIGQLALILFMSVVFVCAFSGCGNKFWDPTQVGRFRPVPATNVILDSLGVAEESPPAWESGEEPRPVDVLAYDTDYTFGPGDVVQISIYELFNEGLMYTSQYIVTETGKISIPEAGVVEASGLTESQLEEEIERILSPHVIKEPSVTVTLLSSQSRVFSIIGNGVPRPARYPIPRYDYRLTDALASAGGISQFNTSYIYVSRMVTGEEQAEEGAALESAEQRPQPSGPPEQVDPRKELMEVIAPLSARGWPVSGESVINAVELTSERDLAEAALPDNILWKGGPVTDSTSDGGAATSNASVGRSSEFSSPAPRVEWVFRDGKWVPVEVGGEAAQPPAKPAEGGKPLAEQVPAGYGLEAMGEGGVQRRVIRIPAERLLGGDPRYNIVVRPGDNIHVPVDIIGEFCIMGNVNRQGFINITGRPMTLKMAIAAAGGLGPLAWPKRCEVVRRIGRKREEIVMVDLDKIASGEQPDFFIKPNDLINVGTHPTARWRAVLRNAFRATYGFGFIYDRNFADLDYGTRRPFPDWF
jgi:polysaccharide export outer membrane protein